MKFFGFLTTIACCITVQLSAQTNSDQQNIQKAQNAISGTNHNCNDALMYLRLVSDSGKTVQDYLLTMANANDCKMNNEQAIFYYEKYLKINGGNDSVKKRIAELKDMQSNAGLVRQQEKKIKELYKGVKKGWYESCLEDEDFSWGFSTNLYSPKNYPYATAVNFFNYRDYAFAKHRMMFSINSTAGYMIGGQKSWWTKVHNTTEDDIISIPGTVQVGLEIAFSAILINKQKYAITLGPNAGFSAMFMNGTKLKSIHNETSSFFLASPVYGLTSNFYLGKHLYAFMGYSIFTKKTFTNSEAKLGETKTVVDGNSLRFGIGMRGFGEPVMRRYY